MGGAGSGLSEFYGARPIVEDTLSLDVRELKRRGCLKPGGSWTWSWSADGEPLGAIGIAAFHDSLILGHTWGRQGESSETKCYAIALVWTRCHFGGERPWFLCPMPGCQRRVAILYAGERFACRHCRNLAYDSQRRPSYWRAGERANKIRKRLGWPYGIFTERGSRPKGMHEKTYRRLLAEYDALAGYCEAIVGACFGTLRA